MIGKAVRLMIILIIFVFDPLAILLLIAANMEMRKNAPQVSVPDRKEEKVMETPSALILPKKPKKPIKPKKPSVPKKKPTKPSKPKIKPAPKKKPIKPKKRPLKKKQEATPAGPDDVITIKKSTVYRFDA